MSNRTKKTIMLSKLTDYKRRKSLIHYSSLVDDIILKKQMSEGKVYLITSPGQREGKSTVSALIGHLLSMRGKKVLLIEANMRTPSLEKTFKVNHHPFRKRSSKVTKNLIDFYNLDLELDEVIVDINGIDVIFAGNPTALNTDLFEMLTSHEIEVLLQYARTKYDFIFLDSPCIKKYKDYLILTELSDGVVLVVEANKTPKRTILMAIEKINTAGREIKGIILNKQINYVPSIIQNLINSL